MSKRLSKHTNRMKEFISKYNARLSALKEHVPVHIQQITFEKAKDMQSSVYANINQARPSGCKVHNLPQITFETKKKILDLKELEKRCIEEEEMLSCECKRLLNHKLSMMKSVKERVGDLQNSEDTFSLGLSSLLVSHSLVVAKQIFNEREAYDLFSISIPDFCVEPQPEYMVEVWQEHRFQEELLESDDSSSSSGSDEEFIDDIDNY